MIRFIKKKWRTLVALTVVSAIGCAMLIGHNKLDNWQSPQVTFYNQGLALYKEGKVDEALVAFDKSLDAYRAGHQRKGLDSIVYPPTSTENAALAESKKAVLYIMKQKGELAIKSFKESLKLNPGGHQFEDLSPEQAKLLGSEIARLTSTDELRLDQQSFIVKHNFELLFKKNPSMAQGEGKGKGKGKGQGNKPGQKPAPGQDPGQQSGRGNRDDI